MTLGGEGATIDCWERMFAAPMNFIGAPPMTGIMGAVWWVVDREGGAWWKKLVVCSVRMKEHGSTGGL